MSFKNHIVIAVLALACTQAHAQLGAGHGARGGATAGSGAVGQSASQAGSSGGRYQWVNLDADPVDQYQPWPEKEVRQYQKP